MAHYEARGIRVGGAVGTQWRLPAMLDALAELPWRRGWDALSLHIDMKMCHRIGEWTDVALGGTNDQSDLLSPPGAA